MLIELKKALSAWQTEAFNTEFKNEFMEIDISLLPLQAGLTQGSYVAEDKGFKVMPINATDNEEEIQVKTGFFYESIIAGCNCADDPTPVDTCNEYCEAIVTINKTTAQATVALLSD